ncbi:nucleotide pyrophosphohydrolase [Mycobacterium phage Bobby]|nr:nucleotide pyrophosphohydrolase [Mycobacterium phage Bobby]
MNFNEYQEGTAKTAIYPGAGNAPTIEGLSYVTLGLAGEAGELCNKVKKIIRDNGGELTAEAREKLRDELSDVLWYAAQFATEIGAYLGDVAEANLAKLADRAERGVLQGSGDNR